MVQPLSWCSSPEKQHLGGARGQTQCKRVCPAKGKVLPWGRGWDEPSGTSAGFPKSPLCHTFLLRNDFPRKMALEEFGAGLVHKANVKSE